MTIKHGSHTFSIDPATTDTYRHYHEGHAERVAMAAPDKFALIVRWSEELGPEEIAERFLADADVVVCEGFKRSMLPKIEVFRRAAHDAPLYGSRVEVAGRYLAIVSDDASLRADVPVLAIEDARTIERLAEIVERDIMGRRAE
jgi:molybdopterin-guanine dinucleotide biosynthesis protein B